MGAAANMAPELFAGVIADVPFVDAFATMLDDSLPLTPPEWLEWGDPIRDRAAFESIRSYSLYDNVLPQRYPAILALAGLADPRVTYWEPAKWVAKLRTVAQSDSPILLKTLMGSGHSGPSGRYESWREEAYITAFVCDQLEVLDGKPDQPLG
jgi:oligopeptidase B